jgi:hypothetical protein
LTEARGRAPRRTVRRARCRARGALGWVAERATRRWRSAPRSGDGTKDTMREKDTKGEIRFRRSLLRALRVLRGLRGSLRAASPGPRRLPDRLPHGPRRDLSRARGALGRAAERATRRWRSAPRSGDGTKDTMREKDTKGEIRFQLSRLRVLRVLRGLRGSLRAASPGPRRLPDPLAPRALDASGEIAPARA